MYRERLMRSLSLLLAAVLGTGVASGCWHASASPTMAHLALVPKTASFVIAIDADALRRTRWWTQVVTPAFDAFWMTAPQRGELSGKCGLEPMRDIHWVMIAIDATGAATHSAVLVNGAWDHAKIEACARALGGAPQAQPDGLTLYKGDLYVGWPAADTLAAGWGADARPFLTEIQRHAPSVLANDAVARQVAHIEDGAALWMAGGLEQTTITPLHAVELDEGLHTVGMFAQLRITDDALAGEGAVELGSPADATRLSAAWGAKLALGRLVLPALAGVATTSAGATAQASVHVDRAALDGLAQMFDAAMVSPHGAPPAPDGS